jgi:cell division protein YceG involved in septum cleavage
MAHRPDSNKKLSMKTRLIFIAIMFVIINLVFYFGFDSSDESESSIEIDDKNLLNFEKNSEMEKEMTISINP